ncbi:hypothetical protein [Clostridium sulfidigenes]
MSLRDAAENNKKLREKLLKKMLTDKRLSSRIVRVVGSNRW